MSACYVCVGVCVRVRVRVCACMCVHACVCFKCGLSAAMTDMTKANDCELSVTRIGSDNWSNIYEPDNKATEI